MIDHARLTILIDSTHPDNPNLKASQSFKADGIAMELVGARHSKRDLINLVRYLLLQCPDDVIPTAT